MNVNKFLGLNFMKCKVSVMLLFTASMFLIACSPKIDCSSNEKYRVSLQEVIDYLAKNSPGDADSVKKFMEQSSFYKGGKDNATCNMNPDQLKYYVRSIGKKKYDPMHKVLDKEENSTLDSVQQSIDEAFGKKKKK